MNFPLAQPHAVYWLLGPCDLTLYIGVTRDLSKRLAVHKSKSKDTWWPFVETHRAIWHPTFREARRVETAELRAVRPLCNPVIPEANGKHITRNKTGPAVSLWTNATAVAEERGETMTALVTRAIELELLRLKKTK